MKYVSILALCVAASPTLSATYYDDRAAFEAALSLVSVDDLNTGLQQGYYYNNVVIDRGDYTLSGSNSGWGYGCVVSGCGNNSSPEGFDYPGYLWNYSGRSTIFTFDTAMHGLGFDFKSPYLQNSNQAGIDGVFSGAASGFFGVIYDTARTVFAVEQTASYMLTDNHTFGVASPAPVPLPAAGGMLLVAMGGLALARRRVGN